MSLEELSFMNYFYDPFYKEEESFNILNPLQNDNSFLDNQPYEHNSPLQNSIEHEDFIMGNAENEERDILSPAEDIFRSSFDPLHIPNENDSQFENDNIEEINLEDKNDNINHQNASDSGLKKTFITSKENGQSGSIQMVAKSKSKKPSKRIDYALKYFKTFFSKYLKDLSNKIIEESKLPSDIKKQKICSPNHISYTGNPKESDDYKFLFFTVQDILVYYKGENCKNSLQKKNKATIESILSFIDESNDESKYEEVRNFFKMSLEQVYELYYKDEAFKKYAEDEKAIYLDQEFKAQNGFSLLENNGFIKVVKMHGKKNKSMKE
jgi:hypothetical protein